MSMDARSKLVRAFQEFGGRVSSEQLLKFIKDDEALSQETKCSMKKIIASIAVIEYGPDQKRYLVLKDLVRDKENLVYNTVCQATQTSAPQLQETHTTPKLVKLPIREVNVIFRFFLLKVANRRDLQWCINLILQYLQFRLPFQLLIQPLRPLRIINIQHIPAMKLVFGLNPKLVNWADPVSGAANASQDSLTVNKDTASKRSAPELPSEFKYPAMLPTTVKRMENFKQRSTPSNLTQHDSLNRTSTLKLISQNGGGSGGCEYTHRRPSVFESILKSAADAAQNWNIKNSGEKIPTESNVQKEGQHDSSNDQPRIDSTNHPYIRLVQRLDSLISLRREQGLRSMTTVCCRSCDIGPFDSSGSSEFSGSGDSSTTNCHCRKSYSLDYRSSIPGHSL
ncbi:unnamed protein product [Heterobilharzia americana]|nr:unnamed protein product [Heterobilharzia americana]